MLPQRKEQPARYAPEQVLLSEALHSEQLAGRC